MSKNFSVKYIGETRRSAWATMNEHYIIVTARKGIKFYFFWRHCKEKHEKGERKFINHQQVTRSILNEINKLVNFPMKPEVDNKLY